MSNKQDIRYVSRGFLKAGKGLGLPISTSMVRHLPEAIGLMSDTMDFIWGKEDDNIKKRTKETKSFK